MVEMDVKVNKSKKDKDKRKKEKKKKKRKRQDTIDEEPAVKKHKEICKSGKGDSGKGSGTVSPKINFPIEHILAPMVGASELPFRILCRKYGAQTCYTPMMSSTKFVSDPQYRREEFQTIKEDRPLVCHFSANDPNEFTEAAKLVQDRCDAVDLNLGCPQRTAYLGHFGSYLLEPKDRKLICDIVRTASTNVTVPIFVKVRLLDTIEDTIKLCQQLKDAGAALIAIHARYRASFERKGAGARDGPALLDQIIKVREALGADFPVIANGNVITYDDVVKNRAFTRASGIMSAEGILDNPALFLPRHGVRGKDKIEIAVPTPFPSSNIGAADKLKRKLKKKLREIEKLLEGKDASSLSKDQSEKVAKKDIILKELSQIEGHVCTKSTDAKNINIIDAPEMKVVKLKELRKVEDDSTILAIEYLDLAESYPTRLRTVIFHTRRMLKKELKDYQLMEECVGSKSIPEIRNLILKISKYMRNPSLFQFDRTKAQQEKEATERKKREEGKRNSYEARMVRKAKREGLEDLEHYLRIGSAVPTIGFVRGLKNLDKKEQMEKWNANNHSQHCMGFHLDDGGCKRDRSCAFLHSDALGANTFAENDEIAG